MKQNTNIERKGTKTQKAQNPNKEPSDTNRETKRHK